MELQTDGSLDLRIGAVTVGRQEDVERLRVRLVVDAQCDGVSAGCGERSELRLFHALVRHRARLGAAKSRLLPDVRVLGRSGAQRYRERRFPAQVPIDAVQTGLECIGVQARDQGTGGVMDFEDHGIVGWGVEYIAERRARLFQQTEGGARRQQARRFGCILRECQ